MADNKTTGLWHELFQTTIVKPNQGRLARGITAAAIAGVVALGAWKLQSQLLAEDQVALRWSVAGVLTAIGCWLAFRITNYSRFVEFLIATETELQKVAWPNRQHVSRATIVVLGTMVTMAALIFAFDALWRFVFTAIGFLEIAS